MEEKIEICPFCKKPADYIVAPEGYRTCSHCKYLDTSRMTIIYPKQQKSP